MLSSSIRAVLNDISKAEYNFLKFDISQLRIILRVCCPDGNYLVALCIVMQHVKITSQYANFTLRVSCSKYISRIVLKN